MGLTGSSAVPQDVSLPISEPARGATRRVDVAGLLRGLAFALVVFALTVVPRLADLGQYVTADEDLTLGRSASFAQAVAGGDWRRTYQIGHPEVTVMWLVTLGIGAEALRPYDDAAQRDNLRSMAAQPGYLDVLVRARAVLALAHGALVVMASLLVWRIWGPVAAAFASFLLALEPFLVAHGRILRTDALLADLALVALLAALAYWWRRAGSWALLLCAVATGLALLTKTPAAILVVAVPLVALRRRDRPWWALGAWLAGAGIVYVAAWPALWERPATVLARVIEYSGNKGGSPMDAGAFLLGTAAPDPGPLFYVIALTLRASPILLAGLIAWAATRLSDNAAMADLASDSTALAGLAAGRQTVTGAPDNGQTGALVLLAVAALFVAAMMVLPKKADRYILPVVPLLATVAAVGLARLVARYRARGAALGCAAVLTAEAAGLVAVWPYPLAYYNPAFGGGATAHAALSVGWGEGLDQVADALNAAPDAGRLTVATLYPEVLQAQFVGRAVPLDEADVADVAVTYVAATQRDLIPPPLAAAIAGREPELGVAINAIPYAEVYRLARPSFSIQATGGHSVMVGQVEMRPPAVVRGRPVNVTLAWTGLIEATAHLEAEIGLLNEGGRVVARTRAPLPARDGELTRYRLTAPSRSGKYRLGLALLDPVTGVYARVEHRPPGTPKLADRLVFPSVTVRVQ